MKCSSLVYEDHGVESKGQVPVTEYSSPAFSLKLLEEKIARLQKWIKESKKIINNPAGELKLCARLFFWGKERKAKLDRLRERELQGLNRYEKHMEELLKMKAALNYFEETSFINKEPRGTSANGLLNAVVHAYANHQGVILTPVAFLHTIMQGVAKFLSDNDAKEIAAENREVLEIEFQAGGLYPKTNANVLAQLLVEKVAGHDQLAAKMKNSMTTTQAYENNQGAFNINLLGAFKNRYQYRAIGWCCGIRRIILDGTPMEWEEIATVVEALQQMAEFQGLNTWFEALIPVMKKLAHLIPGNEADASFMQSMVSYEKGCCSPDEISGWIGVLFPYYFGKLRESFEVSADNRLEMQSLDSDHFFGKVPVLIKFPQTDEEFNLEMVSGIDVEEEPMGDMIMIKPTLVSGFWTDLC